MHYSNLYTVEVVEKFNEKNNIKEQIYNLSLNENQNIINNTQIVLEDNIIIDNKVINNVDVNDTTDINDVEMVSEQDNENYYHYITLCILSDINGFDMKKDFSKMFSINLYQYSLIIRSDDKLPTFAIVEVDENFKYKTYIKSLLLENFGIKNKDIVKIKHMNTNKNFHNYFVRINDNHNLPCSMTVAPSKKLYCKRTFFCMHSDDEMVIKNNKIIINKKEYDINTSDQKLACIILMDTILPPLGISFKGTITLDEIDNTIKLVDIIDAYSKIV